MSKQHHFIVPPVIKKDPRYAEKIRKVLSESEIVASSSRLLYSILSPPEAHAVDAHIGLRLSSKVRAYGWPQAIGGVRFGGK